MLHLFPNGTGSITINGRDIDDYFGLETLKLLVRQPLVTTEQLGVASRSSARDNLLFKPYQNGSKSPENQGFPGFYYI